MAKPSDRMRKLEAMLAQQPTDPFLLYSLGMEHKKANDLAAALSFFDRTLQADPGYCYAYYQKGQTLEETGDPDAAKRAYRDGIQAAVRQGDGHAKSELEGALAMLD